MQEDPTTEPNSTKLGDSKIMQSNEPFDGNPINAEFVSSYFGRLKQYFKLLGCIFAVFVFILVLYYAITKPMYTASAVIGPAQATPTTALFDSMSTSVGDGLASKLMGKSGGTNFYTMFQQMLQSERLMTDLISKDKVLPRVFPEDYKSFDPDTGEASGLSAVVGFIKGILNRPVGYSKGEIELSKYMEKHFSITAVDPPGGSASLSAFTSSSNTYMEVDFSAEDPETARVVLHDILYRADQNIRTDELQDINARIHYIEGELNKVSNSDIRDTLISVLGNQEQIRTMLVSDAHLSYNMISPPYVSPLPTTPKSFGMSIIRTIFLSVVFWLILVALEMKFPSMQAKLKPFRKRSKASLA